MRLFFAVKLPDAAKDQLGVLVDQLAGYPGRVKWVEPRNMHLTLKFLGETDPGMLEDLKIAGQDAAKTGTPFAITLSGCGAFPNLRSPRVFWIGVDDQEKRLPKLQKSLDYNLGQLGFERETRKFSPHLTLGRVKEKGGLGRLLEAFAQVEFPPQKIEVAEFFLIESKLRPTGPIYTELVRFPL